MRNDAHDDIDELPPLSRGRIEPALDSAAAHDAAAADNLRATATPPSPPSSNKAIGLLSALTLAIACSSTAFGWWSLQRMQLLEQQLVATQNSFSKISEDAAGRINAITGKVSATESSVLSGNEALKLRLNRLEQEAVAKHKQLTSRLDQHDTGISKLSTELTALSETSTGLDNSIAAQKTTLTEQATALSALQTDLSKKLENQHSTLQKLTEELNSNQQQLAQLAELKSQLTSTNSKLAKLQENSQHSDELTRIQQDILILRSEVDQLASTATADSSGPSLADFDAYRAQTNRTISALQEQLRNLQKNTP
ncbi:hypothetical protein [Denitrificimonas caeni]|uniref:ATPase n=1 Tax=Denitrificimonas caeni TaxID=521720 RepID=A0AAE9VQY3_9GAMM|nr:hypothetical protein [Denitrificimonas caeni]WBE24710.1 hypothetical protein O6P33_10085 [Denitrificimonas caeni]